jgi:hypothetical protein
MYLAEYTVSGGSWVQAAIQLHYPGAGDASAADRWWTRLRALLSAFDAIPDASASLRVHLDSTLDAALFASAPRVHTEALRRAIGSLSQLDVIANGAVVYPPDRAGHDQQLRFPRYRCRVTMRHFTHADAWFAIDFRVSRYLQELLVEARTLKHALSYHVNVEPFAIDEIAMREAARNALRVASLAGTPPALERLQRKLAEKLRHATHLCEELVGVATPEARAWLTAALDQRVRAEYGQSVVPVWTFEEDGHEGSLAATHHEAFFEPIAADALSAEAIDADEGVDLLAWRPAATLLDLVESGMPAADLEPSATADYSGLPMPYAGNEPFAFISYKREDLDRIRRALAGLGADHRIWYDRGIPGGVEWDALIEDRLRHVLNKPIIGVRLEPDVELRDGMDMLLNQYQTVNAFASPAGHEVDRALRSARVFS